MIALARPDQGTAMAKAYYSTVFEQKAQKVWEIVRDFNNYPVWVGGAGASEIEDGKSGDAIGCVRNDAPSGAADPAAVVGAVRCRTVADLPILRCRHAAAARLSGDPPGIRHH